MKTSTPLVLLILCCLFVGACKSSERATEAASKSMEQELIDQHIAALGGLETLRSIESMRVTGEVNIPSAGMTLPLTHTTPRLSRSAQPLSGRGYSATADTEASVSVMAYSRLLNQ